MERRAVGMERSAVGTERSAVGMELRNSKGLVIAQTYLLPGLLLLRAADGLHSSHNPTPSIHQGPLEESISITSEHNLLV